VKAAFDHPARRLVVCLPSAIRVISDEILVQYGDWMAYNIAVGNWRAADKQVSSLPMRV